MPFALGYCEQAPCADIAETCWSFVARDTGQARILPDGRCDMILKGRVDAAGFVTATEPILTGPATRPYLVKYNAGDVWVGLRLRPNMACVLWRRHLSEVVDHVLRGTPEVRPVLPELADIPATPMKVADLAKRLEQLARNESPKEADGWSCAVVTLILRTGGQMSVADMRELLQADYPLSQRQFTRRFLAQIGLTPKVYCSIIQFHRALRLCLDHGLSASDAAYEAGYADQAHMIRSFQRFGGFSAGGIPEDLALPGFSKIS